MLSKHSADASLAIQGGDGTEQWPLEDFGNELQTYLQGEFGTGIVRITEGGAARIRSARILDELRNRIAEGRRAARVDTDAGDARRSQVNEGPRDASLSTSGCRTELWPWRQHAFHGVVSRYCPVLGSQMRLGATLMAPGMGSMVSRSSTCTGCPMPLAGFAGGR